MLRFLEYFKGILDIGQLLRFETNFLAKRLYRGDGSVVTDLGPEDVCPVQTPERVPELHLCLAEHLLLVGLEAGRVEAVEAGELLGAEAGVLAGLLGPPHAVMREAVHALARRLAHLLHRVQLLRPWQIRRPGTVPVLVS